MSNKPFTRDQEIDLMVNAASRMQGYMAKWHAVPQIKQALQAPDKADERYNCARKVKQVKCA